VVEPDVVGDLVVDAIVHDRFLVLTVPGVYDELVERARDLDGYIAQRAAEVFG
jgi:hypothetical protein